MRSLLAFLDATNDASFLTHARTRMRDSEFISFGRTFLSVLAVAEARDLEEISSRLLPHKLSFEHSTTISETSQATQDEPPVLSNYTEGLQLSEAFRSENRLQSRLIDPAPQSTAVEMFDERDIFAEYTTLEDQSDSTADETAGISADIWDHHAIEMPDNEKVLKENGSTSDLMLFHSENASNTPNLAPTAGNSNMSALSHIADTIYTPSPTQVGHHTKLASPAPSQISSSWTLSPVAGSMHHFPELSTQYLQSYHRLDLLYGGNSKNAVTNLHDVIRLGDSFLRTDAASFIESFCDRWDQRGLWCRPALSNPAREGSTMRRLLRGFHCAELLHHSSVADALRLRVSRFLLYQYFVDLCVEIQTSPTMRLSGKKPATVAINKILDEFCSAHSEQFRRRTREQWKDSLRRHKSIGKRWYILATYLGLGVFLTCSSDLETKMNNLSFTERMILALLTYALNVYPQGIQSSRKLDLFVKCIIDDASPPFPRPSEEVLSEIDRYKQKEEKECYEFRDKWQPVEDDEPPPLPSIAEALKALSICQQFSEHHDGTTLKEISSLNSLERS